MKTLVQTLFFILLSGSVYSQDLAGHWNGALQIQGNQLRIVFHVTQKNNRYETTLDSPDQNVSDINVTTTKVDYPNVRFEIASLGIVYEGTLTDQVLTGKWVQAGNAWFLALSKSKDASGKAPAKTGKNP